MPLLRSAVGIGQPQVSPSRGLALAQLQTAAVVQRRLLAHIFDTAFAGDGRETMNFGCLRHSASVSPAGAGRQQNGQQSYRGFCKAVWVDVRRKIVRKMLKNNDSGIFLGSTEIARDAENNGYEPRGRGFDSCQPHQKNKKRING